MSDLDFSEENLIEASALVLLSPVLWNVLARMEYSSGILQGLFAGDRLSACYAYAAIVLLFSMFKVFEFHEAIHNMPTISALDSDMIRGFSFLLAGVALVMQLAALWNGGGVAGCFMGEYFGLQVKTHFPAVEVQYFASTMAYFSLALWEAKLAGFVLAGLSALTYLISWLFFEKPMSRYIAARQLKSE